MKTALIIDGNYLLNKDVFTLVPLKTLHLDLLNLMKLDIEKLMKMYPYDEIYFVSDSKGKYWRKQILSEYKTSREYDKSIDWSWVYEEYNNLLDYLKENKKIVQLRFDTVEGDDIIAYIVNKNNKKGYSNVIVASDGDLQQLLRFDLLKGYINMQYNYKFSDERIFLPKNYNVFFSEKKRSASNSLFDMTSDDEYLEFLEDLIDKKRVTEVTVEELLFIKFIHGDKGDTISSVFEKDTKTGKKMGIGKDGAKSVYNLYKETYNEEIIFDSEEFIEKAAEMIMFSKKIIDNELLNDIKTKLRRNRSLIKLTDNYLPNYILEQFNEKIF